MTLSYTFQPTRDAIDDLTDYILTWGGQLQDEPHPFAAELATIAEPFRSIMASIVAQSGDGYWYRISFDDDAGVVAFRLAFGDRLLMARV